MEVWLSKVFSILSSRSFCSQKWGAISWHSQWPACAGLAFTFEWSSFSGQPLIHVSLREGAGLSLCPWPVRSQRKVSSIRLAKVRSCKWHMGWAWEEERKRENCVFQHASLSSLSNLKEDFHQAQARGTKCFKSSQKRTGKGPGDEAHFKLSIPFVKP